MKNRALSLCFGLLVVSSMMIMPGSAAVQEDGCALIDFEGMEDVALVGDFYADEGVRFETYDDGNGVAWDILSASLHRDSMCRPASGDQAAHLSVGRPGCNAEANHAPGAYLAFDPPVSMVRFQYAACNDVSIEAYNPTGVRIGIVHGEKTDPNPPFCHWRSIEFDAEDYVISTVSIRGVALIDDLEYCGRPSRKCRAVTIQRTFNDLPIYQGRLIWFNSAFEVRELEELPTTIRLRDSQIEFTSNGTEYILAVPDADITISPAAKKATTVFDPKTRTWVTTIPAGVEGNAFLSGLAFTVPTYLPNYLRLVAWKGRFLTDTPGVKIRWKWAAAVYTQFSNDYNALGVKPVDDHRASDYENHDYAGTPESFTGYVTGGAHGYGITNFTGTYGGSFTLTPCVID